MVTKCKLHPYYRGVGFPTTDRCTDCMDIYIEAHPKLAKRVSDLIVIAKADGVAEYKAQLEAELRRPDMGKVYYPEDLGGVS